MTGQKATDQESKIDCAASDVLNVDQSLKAILCDVLGLEPSLGADFTDETGLFGHLPELDSMAVAGLLTEVEDRMHILIEDDDVDGEMLETYGGLRSFIEAKVAEL